MRYITITFPAIILLVVLCGISIHAQEEPPTVSIEISGIELIVETASDPASREKGLMHRDSLPEGKGMLFIYPDEKKRRLWMKNTPIPLSAAFIRNNGKITQIVHMEKTNSTKIYRSKERAKYALEVPLGWFEKNGIKTGDCCLIPDISHH